MMDSLSKDLLDHIVERLDTIHSRLERQNQEQAVLSGKLSGVSNQLEEEKVFMRDQLQDAQNEILRRLTELQTKGEEPRNLHGSTLQRVELRENTNYEAKGTQEHVPGVFSDEIADKVERSVQDMIRKEFERLNKHFKDSLDETQQNVGREVSESIADFTERTKVQLFAQTAGMDDKLDHIEATNEDLRRKMSTCEEKLATVERMTHHVKDTILTAVNELKSSVVANIKPIFTKKILIFLLLFSAVMLAVWYRSEGLASVKSQIIHQMDNTKAELVSVTSGGIQDTLNKVDDMGASVKSGIIQHMDNTLKLLTEDIKVKIVDKADKTKSEIISVIDKTKRDSISFTEKENQLVRDRITGLLPERKTYICDFYVENFQELVRSGRQVTSLPWHINQFGTSVRGYVSFLDNGKMHVWLMHGRNAREMGLEPKLYGSLKFKATITDTSGGLPDHVVGGKTWAMNGENTKYNGYWGMMAGVVPCDELINKGYGEKEGYDFGALLIRYEITVL